MILIIIISSSNIFYISSALARGDGKGGHTWPIPEAYVALNFGLLELSSP